MTISSFSKWNLAHISNLWKLKRGVENYTVAFEVYMGKHFFKISALSEPESGCSDQYVPQTLSHELRTISQVRRCGVTMGRVGVFYNPDNVYKILLSVKSVSTTTEKQTSRDHLA